MSDAIFRYKHPITGLALPSVTEVIDIINKPFLLPWANGLGFKRIRYDRYMNEVADIGTITHDTLNRILLPENNGVRISFPEEISNPINGFYNFLNKHTLQMLQGEHKIYGEYYAGTIDFVGFLDGIPCIIDFKTSNNFSTTMFLQLVGYKNLLKYSPELIGFDPEELCILKLSRKDTSYSIIPMPKDREPWYNRIFNLCLLLYKEWIINGACNWDGECYD